MEHERNDIPRMGQSFYILNRLAEELPGVNMAEDLPFSLV